MVCKGMRFVLLHRLQRLFMPARLVWSGLRVHRRLFPLRLILLVLLLLPLDNKCVRLEVMSRCLLLESLPRRLLTNHPNPYFSARNIQATMMTAQASGSTAPTGTSKMAAAQASTSTAPTATSKMH